MFFPDNSKYEKLYPEITDQHYLKVPVDHGYVFDKNYPYIDKSKSFRFKRFLLRLFTIGVVFPVASIRMGIRVKGRKYLKEHKKELKNGVISVANHVHMWDYLALLVGVRYFNPNYLAWASNVNGKVGALVRLTGGIPIPENDFEGTKAYLKATKEFLEQGGWLHINAEGSMWELYPYVRPFKKGIGHFAITTDKPILPFGLSYRKPGFIRSKIFKQKALITVNIGELIYRNKDLPRKEQENDLLTRCHKAVCKLCGIENNIYPPIFENNKKIEYEKE